jgi:hypothetical protein
MARTKQTARKYYLNNITTRLHPPVHDIAVAVGFSAVSRLGIVLPKTP